MGRTKSSGMTAVWIAARHGDLETLENLIEILRQLLRVPDESFRQRLKSLLQVQLMARELELQPWCHQAARDWLCQNELEELRRNEIQPVQYSLNLWTAGDDELEFRQKAYYPAMTWMDYMQVATESMAQAVGNGERVVFLTRNGTPR
jgi:hypothetical protein